MDTGGDFTTYVIKNAHNILCAFLLPIEVPPLVHRVPKWWDDEHIQGSSFLGVFWSGY